MNRKSSPSDSSLFFELFRKTEACLALWCEIDYGSQIDGGSQWEGIPEDLKDQLKDLLDVPYVDSILINALDDIEQSLKLAEEISRKASLEPMIERIQSIRSSKPKLHPTLDQFDPGRAGV